MPKQHPKSLLLIEKQDMLRWRVVDRKTTLKGLSPDHNIIAENIPRFGIARHVFDSLKQTIRVTAVMVTMSTTGYSAPPEGANPVYKRYFETLVTKEGWGCCSIADCREVRIENRADGPYVFIDKKSFGETAPEDWVKVPSSAYGTRNNLAASEQSPVRPAGATACWYQNQIRCFDWPLPGI